MVIDFKYSMVYDLMFHILAHMNVENASNLYSKKYISAVATGQSPSEEWLAALGAETEKAAFEYMKVSWQ